MISSLLAPGEPELARPAAYLTPAEPGVEAFESFSPRAAVQPIRRLVRRLGVSAVPGS